MVPGPAGRGGSWRLRRRYLGLWWTVTTEADGRMRLNCVVVGYAEGEGCKLYTCMQEASRGDDRNYSWVGVARRDGVG